jgi:amino acid transporter
MISSSLDGVDTLRAAAILPACTVWKVERTGGSPSYAYVAYKDKWPRAAKHINGVTAWMYWLGWFPVAPLNMILASFYLADLFNLNTTSGFTPINTFISWSTLVISIIGILLFFIPAYLGIRFGTGFATILALLSMIPLTFIAIAWIFNPSVVDWSQLSGFHQLDGSSFFSGLDGYGWLTVYIAYSFLLTWNVIAMEAAACYIGECKNPERDAKIAMNLEGAYGLFIYTMIRSRSSSSSAPPHFRTRPWSIRRRSS